MLRSASGELVRFVEDGPQHFVCRAATCIGGSRHHSFLAPFFIIVRHGFADAIGIGDEEVSRFEAQALLGINGKRQQTNHRAIGFEAENFGGAVSFLPQDQRSIVSGIDAF